MADFKDLSNGLHKMANGVADNADRLTRRCALAIDAAVVLATPVDTGRARSNWQVQLDQPASGEVGDEKSQFDRSGQQAIDAGKAVIQGYKSGSSINITNNLPYIERLNNGWSAQAPVGFVERAVQVGVDAISQEAPKIAGGTVQEKSE